MACNIALGRKEPCKQNIGGIDELYLMKWSEVDYDSMTGITSEDLPIFTFVQKGGGNVIAYKFDLKGINSFESTSTVSQETAGKVFDQSITITLKGIDQTSSLLFAEIVSTRTVAFVKDRNSDEFYFFGATNGMTNNGVFSSGQAAADLSGVTFTMTGQERLPYKTMVGTSTSDLAAKNIVVSATQI
jgi:hypothetical protein